MMNWIKMGPRRSNANLDRVAVLINYTYMYLWEESRAPAGGDGLCGDEKTSPQRTNLKAHEGGGRDIS